MNRCMVLNVGALEEKYADVNAEVNSSLSAIFTQNI
jgi:hypothetical protein